MSLEEIVFKRKTPTPKLGERDLVLRTNKKSAYLGINSYLSGELIDKGFKFCSLEWDRETNEMRIKFRKFSDPNTVSLQRTSKASKSLRINHGQFVEFIKSKLGITEKAATLDIGPDRSNVPTVQTRYISIRKNER